MAESHGLFLARRFMASVYSFCPLYILQAMRDKPGVATDAPQGGKPMLTLLRSISGAFRPVRPHSPSLHTACHLMVSPWLQLSSWTALKEPSMEP